MHKKGKKKKSIEFKLNQTRFRFIIKRIFFWNMIQWRSNFNSLWSVLYKQWYLKTGFSYRSCTNNPIDKKYIDGHKLLAPLVHAPIIMELKRGGAQIIRFGIPVQIKQTFDNYFNRKRSVNKLWDFTVTNNSHNCLDHYYNEKI